MRLDKYLCDAGIGTRSQVKEIIRRKAVTVNGKAVTDAGMKIDAAKDIILYQDRQIVYTALVYYLLNKPAGVVSATRDSSERTVLDLLSPTDYRDDIFPAGRLDKDTEGFLLLTNDGPLAHKLLAPRRHVDKTYEVHTESPVTEAQIRRLETGVDIGEDKPTAPASATLISEQVLLLTIHEGKFHQVKRMLQAVGNSVVGLKRISFGGLKLDETLLPGQYRALTESEVAILHEA